MSSSDGGVPQGGVPEGDAPESETGLLEAFSDGVLAVIITIMALELKAPVGKGDFGDLHERIPALLVYILSFTFIGIYWVNHHHLLRAAERISGSAMWANLFLLFWLSLLPVMTEWVRNEYQHSLPAAAYGVVGLAAGFAYSLLIGALIRANGPDSPVARAIGSNVKGYASLVAYAAGVILAPVSPWISYAIYAAVALMWFVPDRRLARL